MELAAISISKKQKQNNVGNGFSFLLESVDSEMKYQDLTTLLETDPRCDNLALAKQWLLSKSQMSKSVESVVHAFIKATNNKEEFAWLSETWLLKKNWKILYWSVEKVNLTPEVIDWVVEYLCANPKHEDAGKLWEALLMKHNSPGLSSKASQWLLDHETRDGAADVASALLSDCRDPLVLEKAKQLVWENPAKLLLMSKVIELAGDEEIEELAVTRLKIVDFVPAGMFLAVPLLQGNSRRYAPLLVSWLHENSSKTHFESILAEVFAAAPLELAPFVFEWLEENPEIDKVERIFQTAFILQPSQWLLDRAWNWVSTHLKEPQTARMLNVILQDVSEELKCPEGACALADSWLVEHLGHAKAKDLLLSVLRIEATPNRIDLARRWMRSHKVHERGEMLMSLASTEAFDEVEEEAIDWCYQHPNDRVSHGILLRILRRNPKKEYILEAKRVLKSNGIHKYFCFSFLSELVMLGDKDSFGMAFSLIESSEEWRTSLSEMGGDLLLRLLQQLQGDKRVLRLIDEWLTTGADESQELSEKIIRERDKHLDRL